MSAASRARKLNSQLEIIVLEKGLHISYGTCGLPYYLSGQVADARELIVYTADFFREKRNIDVRLEHEVIEIEPGRKCVHALDRRAHPVVIGYDKLVITTGGAPELASPAAISAASSPATTSRAPSACATSSSSSSRGAP